jgi:hypothetical protein
MKDSNNFAAVCVSNELCTLKHQQTKTLQKQGSKLTLTGKTRSINDEAAITSDEQQRLISMKYCTENVIAPEPVPKT